MGKGMAQRVRVDVADAGLFAASHDEPVHAALRDAPALTEPEPSSSACACSRRRSR